MNKLFKEFRDFAVKGNAFDMAIGIIIGAAFSNIVNSLVNDIIMPPIGFLLGGVDFGDLAITLKAATETDPAVTVGYGAFLNTLINFGLIAFSIFICMKAANTVIKRKEKKTTEKSCPKCLMKIPLNATKCGYCTAELSSAKMKPS